MARPTKKLAKIEKAAMQLISRYGLAQVTIKAIARAADCAEGALYRHYPSKDQMAWTLFSREMKAFAQRLDSVFQFSGSFPSRAKEAVSVFYHFFDEDEDAFRFILLAQHDFPQATPIDPASNPIDLVIRFVQEGMDAGQFRRQDANVAAAMVLGLVLQPATMRVYGRIEGPLTDRIETIARACLNVLCD